jgi:hypothetical protein
MGLEESEETARTGGGDRRRWIWMREGREELEHEAEPAPAGRSEASSGRRSTAVAIPNG